MPIPTSRTKEASSILIDETLCNGCELCVAVCGDESLMMENGKAVPSHTPMFGCMGCGQCMAICPKDAIKITGRFISPEDLFPLPLREESSSYDSLLKLLQRRRSIRDFKDKPVEPEMVEKILEMVRSAPMGIPPSDVHMVLLDSREKVRGFAIDYCKMLESMKWFVSGWFIALMRPFWGKTNDELFRGFLRPLVHSYIDRMNKGENTVTYDAPLAMYFYGSPYTDPADPVIAATYAMIGAESLGLGTCMLGAVHPFIQSGSAARKFREKYGIRYKSREGLVVIMGYPKLKFRKGIRRNMP